MASGTAGGTPSKQDKAAFIEGTDYLVPIGGVVNDTLSADVAEDKVAAPRITPKRALHSNLRDSSGVESGTSSNPLRTDPTGTTTQPVSAASLPLPTGAATSALQTTGNTSLSSLDSKVPAQGQALAAGSTPVVLPVAQITTLTPPAAITNFANETGGNLAAIKAKTDNIPSSPATDRATAVAPFSTRLSDGTSFYKATTTSDTQPVSAASLPLPANAAKETGGNLDTIAALDFAIGTSVGIMDDWDESDRCKTNPIVGSAGVAGNTGTVGATTQRVTLATDVALPIGTNVLGSVNLTATTVGGYSVSSQTNLTTTATVSSSAGKFGGVEFLNLNSTPAYIQVFDTTAAVTLGTTTPTFVIAIPAASTAANGAGVVQQSVVGVAMANGIKIAATTTATGATTVTTGVIGHVTYK